MPSPAPLTTRPFDPLPLYPTMVLGWVAYDMASFGAQGSPHLTQALLPGSVVALLLACIAGRLWQEWPRFMHLLAGLALVGSVLPMVVNLPIADDVRWLPRCILVQSTLLLGLRAAAAKRWLPLATLACVLGALSAVAFAWLLEFKSGSSLSLGRPTQLTLGAALLAGLPSLSARARALPFGSLAAVLWLGAVLYTGSQAQNLRRPDQTPDLPASAPGPNLLMVVLDTVRADHLGSYGHERNTTPNIDRVVSQYATHYSDSSSTSSWTLPSHASLFTGLFPDEHGATRPRPEDASGLDLQAWPACALRPDVEPLAERLQAEGFDTAAVVANITFLRHEFGLDRGFAHYDDRTSTYMPRRIALAQLFGKAERVGALPYRGAETVSKHALDWLDGHYRDHSERPFFLMLNYMDAHAPQLPEPPFDKAFSAPLPEFEDGQAGAEARTRYLQELAYDRGIFYSDSHLGRIFDDLEQRGELENTVIVVTSDHGESFGEHGYWLHGWNLHAETVLVPLLIKQAGKEARARVEDATVTGADVMDLCLAALGLPGSKPRSAEHSKLAEGMLGQLYMTDALLEKFAAKGWDNPGLNQIAWREGSTKWLVNKEGMVLAYDVQLDPGELQPLALSPEQVSAAQAKAAAWWQAHPPLKVKGAALSDEDRDRLGDLGYMGDEED